jgi:hypothetical protein
MLEQAYQNFNGFTEDEISQGEQYQYNSDAYIDAAIARIKNRNQEIDRLNKILEERIEMLKLEAQTKIDRIQKQNDYEMSMIASVIKDNPNKKETKTQFKVSFISGDVVIKKPEEKINKPKIEEKVLTTDDRLSDYIKTKEVKELNWDILKSKLIIKDNKVINTETGEEYTDIVPITTIPERIEVK